MNRLNLARRDFGRNILRDQMARPKRELNIIQILAHSQLSHRDLFRRATGSVRLTALQHSTAPLLERIPNDIDAFICGEVVCLYRLDKVSTAGSGC
jgi:hypothetical protein